MSLVFLKLTYYFSKQSKKKIDFKKKKKTKNPYYIWAHFFPHFFLLSTFFLLSLSQLLHSLFFHSRFFNSQTSSPSSSLLNSLSFILLPLFHTLNSISFSSHTPFLVSSLSTVNFQVYLGTPPTNSHFSSSIQWGVPFVSLLIPSMLSGHL